MKVGLTYVHERDSSIRLTDQTGQEKSYIPISDYTPLCEIKRGQLVSIATTNDILLFAQKHTKTEESANELYKKLLSYAETFVTLTDVNVHQHAVGIAREYSVGVTFTDDFEPIIPAHIHIISQGMVKYDPAYVLDTTGVKDLAKEANMDYDANGFSKYEYVPDFLKNYEENIGKTVWAKGDEPGNLTIVAQEAYLSYKNIIKVAVIADATLSTDEDKNKKPYGVLEVALEGDERGPIDATQIELTVGEDIKFKDNDKVKLFAIGQDLDAKFKFTLSFKGTKTAITKQFISLRQVGTEKTYNIWLGSKVSVPDDIDDAAWLAYSNDRTDVTLNFSGTLYDNQDAIWTALRTELKTGITNIAADYADYDKITTFNVIENTTTDGSKSATFIADQFGGYYELYISDTLAIEFAGSQVINHGSYENRGKAVLADCRIGSRYNIVGLYLGNQTEIKRNEQAIFMKLGAFEMASYAPFETGKSYYLAFYGNIQSEFNPYYGKIIKVGTAETSHRLIIDARDSVKSLTGQDVGYIKPTANNYLDNGFVAMDGETRLSVDEYKDLYNFLKPYYGDEILKYESDTAMLATDEDFYPDKTYYNDEELTDAIELTDLTYKPGIYYYKTATFIVPKAQTETSFNHGEATSVLYQIKYRPDLYDPSIVKEPFIRRIFYLPETNHSQCTLPKIDITPLVMWGPQAESLFTDNLEQFEIKLYIDPRDGVKADDTHEWTEVQPGFHLYDNTQYYGYKWRIERVEATSELPFGIWYLVADVNGYNANLTDKIGETGANDIASHGLMIERDPFQDPIYLYGHYIKIYIARREFWHHELNVDKIASASVISTVYKKIQDNLDDFVDDWLEKNYGHKKEVAADGSDWTIISDTRQRWYGKDAEGDRLPYAMSFNNGVLYYDAFSTGTAKDELATALKNAGKYALATVGMIDDLSDTVQQSVAAVQSSHLKTLSSILFETEADESTYALAVDIDTANNILPLKMLSDYVFYDKSKTTDALSSDAWLMKLSLEGYTASSLLSTNLSLPVRYASYQTKYNFGAQSSDAYAAIRASYNNGEPAFLLLNNNGYADLTTGNITSQGDIAWESSYKIKNITAEFINVYDLDNAATYPTVYSYLGSISEAANESSHTYDQRTERNKVGLLKDNALSAFYELPTAAFIYKNVVDKKDETKRHYGVIVERVSDAINALSPDNKRYIDAERDKSFAFTYLDDESNSIKEYLNLMLSKTNDAMNISSTVGILAKAAGEAERRLLSLESSVFGYDASTIPGGRQIAPTENYSLKSNYATLFGVNRLVKYLSQEIFGTEDPDTLFMATQSGNGNESTFGDNISRIDYFDNKLFGTKISKANDSQKSFYRIPIDERLGSTYFDEYETPKDDAEFLLDQYTSDQLSYERYYDNYHSDNGASYIHDTDSNIESLPVFGPDEIGQSTNVFVSDGSGTSYSIDRKNFTTDFVSQLYENTSENPAFESVTEAINRIARKVNDLSAAIKDVDTASPQPIALDRIRTNIKTLIKDVFNKTYNDTFVDGQTTHPDIFKKEAESRIDVAAHKLFDYQFAIDASSWTGYDGTAYDANDYLQSIKKLYEPHTEQNSDSVEDFGNKQLVSDYQQESSSTANASLLDIIADQLAEGKILLRTNPQDSLDIQNGDSWTKTEYLRRSKGLMQRVTAIEHYLDRIAQYSSVDTRHFELDHFATAPKNDKYGNKTNANSQRTTLEPVKLDQFLPIVDAYFGLDFNSVSSIGNDELLDDIPKDFVSKLEFTEPANKNDLSNKSETFIQNSLNYWPVRNDNSSIYNSFEVALYFKKWMHFGIEDIAARAKRSEYNDVIIQTMLGDDYYRTDNVLDTRLDKLTYLNAFEDGTCLRYSKDDAVEATKTCTDWSVTSDMTRVLHLLHGYDASHLHYSRTYNEDDANKGFAADGNSLIKLYKDLYSMPNRYILADNDKSISSVAYKDFASDAYSNKNKIEAVAYDYFDSDSAYQYTDTNITPLNADNYSLAISTDRLTRFDIIEHELRMLYKAIGLLTIDRYSKLAHIATNKVVINRDNSSSIENDKISIGVKTDSDNRYSAAVDSGLQWNTKNLSKTVKTAHDDLEAIDNTESDLLELTLTNAKLATNYATTKDIVDLFGNFESALISAGFTKDATQIALEEDGDNLLLRIGDGKDVVYSEDKDTMPSIYRGAFKYTQKHSVICTVYEHIADAN